jgi:branched-chain amino acid transport system permease protein
VEFILQLLVGGLRLGSIYALVGLGYSLIYRATGLLTFVQGEYFMLGGFIGFTLLQLLGLPLYPAVLLTTLLMLAIGMLTEKALVRPLLARGSKTIHIVLATIGLSIFLRNVAMLVWGTDVKSFPFWFGEAPLRVAGLSVTPQDLTIVIITIGLMVLLHLFMEKTRLGMAMRAAAQDKLAAGTLGINVPFTIGLTWGLAAALAGLAGTMIAPIYGVSATMGILVGLKGFAAAVVGGYGSMYGAFLGGLFLGVLETFSAGYISSASKDIIIFGVLLVVLIFMPRGFLAVPVIEEIES